MEDEPPNPVGVIASVNGDLALVRWPALRNESSHKVGELNRVERKVEA